MELSEFIEETKRLTDYYDKEYNSVQEREIFNRLKSIDIEHYRRIINKLIDTEERLPKVNKILYFKEMTYDSQTNTYEKPPEQVHCDNCLGSGLINFTKKIYEVEYEYQARCNCKNAEPYNKWLDADGNNLIPSAEELGLI